MAHNLFGPASRTEAGAGARISLHAEERRRLLRWALLRVKIGLVFTRARESLQHARTRFAKGHTYGLASAKLFATALGLFALAAIGSPKGASLLGLAPKEALARTQEPATTSPSQANAPAASAMAAPPAPQASAGGAPTTSETTQAPASAPRRGRATPEDPVYVNEADATELSRLPGIGAKRAAAILALRERKKHFARVEELLVVKGIGPKTLVKLRPLIRLTRSDSAAQGTATDSTGKGKSPPK